MVVMLLLFRRMVTMLFTSQTINFFQDISISWNQRLFQERRVIVRDRSYHQMEHGLGFMQAGS